MLARGKATLVFAAAAAIAGIGSQNVTRGLLLPLESTATAGAEHRSVTDGAGDAAHVSNLKSSVRQVLLRASPMFAL